MADHWIVLPTRTVCVLDLFCLLHDWVDGEQAVSVVYQKAIWEIVIMTGIDDDVRGGERAGDGEFRRCRGGERDRDREKVCFAVVVESVTGKTNDDVEVGSATARMKAGDVQPIHGYGCVASVNVEETAMSILSGKDAGAVVVDQVRVIAYR